MHYTDSAMAEYNALKAAADAAAEGRKAKGNSKATKQEGLFCQVAKTIKFLANNPKHPGLQTHEYDDLESPYKKGDKVFEAYAQNNSASAYRVFWCYGPKRGDITIIAITAHP